jgi:hypothetical protein
MNEAQQLHNITTDLLANAARCESDEQRILRAHDMFQNGVRVERLDANYFLVQSATHDETIYLLDKTGCPCLDRQHRPELTHCKHMWCAVIFNALQMQMAKR